MAMVEVGIAHMPVAEAFMPAPMRMRLGHRSVMGVLAMFVVNVPALVLDRLVRMFVTVPSDEARDTPAATS